MRASLASATSLLALLLVEGREAYATPTITAGSTITFSLSGGVAGDVFVGATVSGSDVATVKGGSGTTLSFSAGSGSFGPSTVQSFASITTTTFTGTGTYTFAPTTTGAASKTVTVSDSGGGTAQTVTLIGTGVAPIANAPAANVTVSNIYGLVGQTASAAAILSISNTGNGNLAGSGSAYNLNGSITGGNSVFVGTATNFSLTDNSRGTTLATSSQSFAYTFQPTITGAASTTVTTTFSSGEGATNQAGTTTTTITGTGVAPVESVTPSTTNNLVSVGSTVSNTITVANIGNGNLAGSGTLYNLNGSITNTLGTGFTASSSNQSSIRLASNATASVASTATTTLGYTYTPLSRGTSSSTVSIAFSNGSAAGTNASQTVVTTLTGTAVGPVYKSSIQGASVFNTPSTVAGGTVGVASSTIALGAINTNVSRTVYLDLENTTTDPGGSLTNLTIDKYSIAGSSAFTVSLAGNSVISEGGYLVVPITVVGTAGYQALSSTLTIFTDESTTLGGVGDTFTYALTANSIPEPTSLLALGAGLAGLASMRRRRAASSV